MSPLTSFRAMSLGAALLTSHLASGQTTTLPPSLTNCTTSETIWQTPKNVSMAICDGTDFKYGGKSLQMVEGVCGTRACVGLCNDNDKCVRAVYDKKNSVCHIKNNDEVADMIWAVDADFDAIIKLRADGTYPPPPSGKAPAEQQPAKPANETITGDAKKGTWSDVIKLPLIPVAAYVVPTFPTPGRLMFFSSWGVDAFGGASGLTQFGSLDLASLQSTHREIANTRHDMFCPGISQLADGRILIQGGSDAEAVSAYDPKTDSFTRESDLKIARGYQSAATLSNGEVFTIGGAYSGERRGKEGEMYDPTANAWEVLKGADVKPMLTQDRQGIWREDNHAWLFAWRNGSVFQAGPSKTQHWYGTKGYGAVVAAGTRDDANAMCGIFVMYDALRGKILTAGGAPDYTDSDANNRAHITTIGEPGAAAAVERVPDMAFSRGFANAVVLPDGKVVVTGGMKRAIVFNDKDSVLVPEMFDPATKTWTQLAAAQKPRNYHSVSILLPDATVFVGGGGLCYVATVKGSTARCDKTVDHADGEILSPPYLFNADGSASTRPVIGDLDRTAIRAGDALTFAVSGIQGAAAASYKFSLVRMGSVTHSVNTDQRRVPLEDFSVGADGKFTVRTPADTGVMIPGFWYLFAIAPNGTPSVAKTVQIELGEAESRRTAGLWGA
ncbi:hypothetical protein PpBr36_06937 [Pyricularia pennisetigena]|uniref:hypothetical protein n=1 Tax=Pyricularia pennisetigena TaxID=1578925 RepID=UPI001151EF34|nr:hypothetical protein PpBr36_06937 [Pyricularia pennisetigena]TLS25571.1 hypothetical protein PpBr36_06937 [Pyricularia pennisetigena]